MDQTDCDLCKDVPGALTLRCFDCKQISHIHNGRMRDSRGGDTVAIECPNCHAVNAVRKQEHPAVRGSRLIIHAVQPELTP